jgi:hypothetical protein
MPPSHGLLTPTEREAA